MSEVEQQIEEMHQYKVEQKTLVDARDAALRLYSHPDFKNLIMDGFCLNEAARYAQESGDPMLTPVQRADALALAQASGHLKRFLSVVVLMGNTAANNILQADDHISSLTSGEGTE